MLWLRRNRVVLTVLLGLALIGSLAVSQSGLALLAISRFRTDIARIADLSLPELIAPSQLSEQSRPFAAWVSETAQADSQVRRQTTTDRLKQRLNGLGQAVARVENGAAD